MAASKPVTLRDVTADNWEAVTDLELTDEQEDLVADNSYSLAESKFDPHAVPKAIYAGRKLVGFIMYEPLTEDGRPNDYLIYRFMIDRRQQGKGYGRAALEKLIGEIKADPAWNRIVICYVEDNAAARKFYRSLGFVETGRDEDNEIIAEIRNEMK
jgi:diamine N-acetyltransferase